MLQYTTIYRLRQEGFGQADYPEAESLLVIQRASEYLTDLLGQWFVPVRHRKRLDGHGSSIVYFPNRIPFLEVISLGEVFTASEAGDRLPRRMDVLIGSGDRTTYLPSEYTIRGRRVELLYSNFYQGRGNVDIDCYTGLLDWFDMESRNFALRKVEASLDTLVSHDHTEAVVDSVDGFRERDVILFESDDTARDILGQAVVNQITRNAKKLLFDKVKTLNEADIPVGTKVVTFGSVPRLIERAAILLFKKLYAQINTDDYADSLHSTKLKSEKTDSYSYTLFGGKEGGGMGITGDPMVDSMLSKYSEPHSVDLV